MQSEFSLEGLVKHFESGTLAPELFHHQEHVKIAWWYLQNYSLVESIARFTSGIKHFARQQGKESLYHETITLAYVLLINERIYKTGNLLVWGEFANANSDLLDWQNNSLKHYYQENTLNSELARRVFVLPDKSIIF